MKKLTQTNLNQYLPLLLIFVVGVFLGISVLITYQNIEGKNEASNRNNALDFLNETSLLINENQALQSEVSQLQEDVLSSKNNFTISENTRKTIESLNKILGNIEATGSGISFKIPDELPYYAFIDIINDLNTLGAEAVAINGLRITSISSFSENPLTHQNFISHMPVSAPYIISVIGDDQSLTSALQGNSSFLQRLRKGYGIEDEIIVGASKSITLPQKVITRETREGTL